jgi:hypothetical protein
MPDGMGGRVGRVQADGTAVLGELDWTAISQRRPDLSPPGYEEAVARAQEDSERKYERLGRRRAGKSGRSKGGQFPGLKHGAD